jgi:hypothetical protein
VSKVGWPLTGVVLFELNNAPPMIAVRSEDIRKTVRAGDYLGIGVGSVLVDGDAEAWGELMHRLGTAGARTGLLEAPLSTRSRHQFTTRLAVQYVVVDPTTGD